MKCHQKCVCSICSVPGREILLHQLNKLWQIISNVCFFQLVRPPWQGVVATLFIQIMENHPAYVFFKFFGPLAGRCCHTSYKNHGKSSNMCFFFYLCLPLAGREIFATPGMGWGWGWEWGREQQSIWNPISISLKRPILTAAPLFKKRKRRLIRF